LKYRELFFIAEKGMNVLTVQGCCCLKKNNTLKKILLLNILLFSSSLTYSQFDGISKVGHKAIDLTRSPVFKKNKQVENRHIHSSKRNKNTIKKWVKPYYSLSQEPLVAQNNQQAQQSIFPSLRYTGRSELDPLGTLRINETTLIESEFSQRGISRWGDYSAMTIDPVDDCTFWYTASYVGSDDKTPLSASTWSTRIASFQFPECGGQLNTPIHNFDGIDFTGSFPSDPVGDVGLNYYIQMANSPKGAVFKIFSKQDGRSVTQLLELSSLWQGDGACINGRGDPIVVWDQFSDRWVMMELGRNLRSLCLYISVSDDPIYGGWYSYQIDTPNFPDYPKMAVYADTNNQGAYIITTNEPEPAVYVIDRMAMLKGLHAEVKRLEVPRLPGYEFQALTPADVEGHNALKPGTPAYLTRHFDDEIHAPDYALEHYDFIELWSIDLGFETHSDIRISGINRIPVAEFESELCGTLSKGCFGQPETGTLLDPLFEVVMWRVTHRNLGEEQVLLGNFTVDANTNNQGGIRWFELRKENKGFWHIHQQNTYAPDNANRWMGSIAMDGFGNVAMGYTVSAEAPEITDTTEPNDSVLSAYPLVCGTSNHTALISANDVDYYYVEGVSGQTVKINIDAALDASPLNSLMGVFDVNFNLLQTNETGVAVDEFITEDSYLVQIMPPEGAMYIAIASSGDDLFEGKNGQSMGFYRLSISCDFTKADPFEPNNSFLTATEMSCPATTMDTRIGVPFDSDYYKFSGLHSNQVVEFLVDTNESFTLRAFNSKGQLLAISMSSMNSAPSINISTPDDGVIFVFLAASDLKSTGEYILKCLQ